MSGEPVELKRALRLAVRERRRAMSTGERAQASAGAVVNLLCLPDLNAARTVALYAALPDEADPTGAMPELVARGMRPLFPRVTGRQLEFVPAGGLELFLPGYRGVREPVGEPVSPDAVDLIVVPGVAFDRAGGRLGQGGGHYDRLLASLPTRTARVGFCLSVQLVASVPRTAHDEPVDVLVTETGTVRTAARRGLLDWREDSILPDG